MSITARAPTTSTFHVLFTLQCTRTLRLRCANTLQTPWSVLGKLISSGIYPFAWPICRVSAANNARIYELEHDIPQVLSWPVSLSLTGELVWDAFFLHGLICDSHDRSKTLVLSDSTHPDRLHEALEPKRAKSDGRFLMSHYIETSDDLVSRNRRPRTFNESHQIAAARISAQMERKWKAFDRDDPRQSCR